jgi:16S rRNA (guanine527-N7)-methyltransferase
MTAQSKPDNRLALQARLDGGANELGVVLSAAQSERLLDYIDLLVRWNAAYNLTAVRDPAEMVTRHLLDSLAIAHLVSGKSLVDLGSGAGLPGVPLAILDSERQIKLIDSNGKKARFQREAVRALGLRNVSIEHARAEDVPGTYDCVVARAFASLSDLLVLGGHLIAPDGFCLAMKGLVEKEEGSALPAGFAIERIVPLHVPGLGAARHAVIIRRRT